MNIFKRVRNFFRLYPSEDLFMAYIRPTDTGNFRLIDNEGNVIGFYTRARDARRGARRRGMIVA